ncbi:zinc finger protein ZFP2-like [Wyeomyia smithii]|uniref:zinc finger protein ZFP2-like n=1 Tax=Wyeomyia smithii TaxID=174621 RepID=UPI002467F7EE|nr:zinc finger protein ZFP2-like [Wyeomyia smithii]
MDPVEAISLPATPDIECTVSSLKIETNYIDSIDYDHQLSSFCRLCLRELPKHMLSGIDDGSTSDMILEVAGVNVQDREDLPTMICSECKQNLHTAYGIRKSFLEADLLLRRMVLNSSVPLVVSLAELHKNNQIELTEEAHFYDEHTSDNDAYQIQTLAADDESIPEQKRLKRKKRPFHRHNFELNETKLDPNKCYICSSNFDDSESLNAHLPAHVDMIPYNCEECAGYKSTQNVVKSVILLHQHFRMHAGSIECPECPFKTCTAVGLYSHMHRNHSKETDIEYTCEICGSKMLNRRNYMFHVRSHKVLEEGRFTCPFCDKKFATKARLVRHERSHTNEKPFQCNYCEKSFTNKTSLNTHERTHTGEKGYRCDYCGNCYRTNGALKDHLRSSVHADQVASKPRNQKSRLFFVEAVKCDVEGCDFMTDNRAKHYSHKRKHEMKFHCEHCSERFATRQRLQQHMFKHTGVKSFCCELCGKSFRFKNSLNEHRDKHSGVRPYTCEVCGLAFVRERTLKAHRMKHTDGMNFECRFCEKKFKYRADQSKHERYHIGTVMEQELIDYDETLHTMDLIEVDDAFNVKEKGC